MNSSNGLNLPTTSLPTTAAQAKAFMSTSFPVVKDDSSANNNTTIAKQENNTSAIKEQENGVSKQEEVASSEDAASGIVPTLQNIVATVNLDCRLDLKTIALHARNAEYNPKVCTNFFA